MNVKRKSMTIFFNNIEDLQALDKSIFNIYYTSTKMKYCVVYFDLEKTDLAMKNIKRIRGITEACESFVPVDTVEF